MWGLHRPRPESHLEHARAAAPTVDHRGWRQTRGTQAARVGFFLGFGMIGQRRSTPFLPEPRQEASACSPEPADPGTALAAVAQSRDVAVRSG